MTQWVTPESLAILKRNFEAGDADFWRMVLWCNPGWGAELREQFKEEIDGKT